MGKEEVTTKKTEEVVDKEKEAKAEEVEKPIDPYTDLKKNIQTLERAIVRKELSKTNRVLRVNTRIRKTISAKSLAKAVQFYLPQQYESRSKLGHWLGQIPAEPTDMDVEEPQGEESKDSHPTIQTAALPEIEAYLAMLVLTFLLSKQMMEQAKECAMMIIDRSHELNRRSLDPFTAKAYSYLSYCYEKQGQLEYLRSMLVAAHRTACLRHNEIGQATLLNLLLRNYLSYNMYDQAVKLVSKTSFPESASNNQFVRYLYYVGKIQAVQLEYTESYTKLMQAIRKAPQNTALGFRIMVQKLAIIVQLLTGEIPERVIFDQPEFGSALGPYLELTQAVRIGSLSAFNQVLRKDCNVFKKDNTYTLILRLRHNVIKAGLRKISVSYSKISFQDICAKLGLDNPQNAELICAKAIRDGVIDAVINHEGGYMQSKELLDVYTTSEPQQAFNKRITFCLDVHNDAVKAMRYPPDAYKKELESAQERLEREKQEEELAKEIEDEMDEEGL